MKPILEHLPKQVHESFVVRAFEYGYFPTPWHYHPEYELVLVKKGEGTRFVGDNIMRFTENDLCLLGADLPHYYRNTPEYYQNNSDLRVESIVVHFLPHSFGKGFEELPEAQAIITLLENSKQGLEITGVTRDIIVRKLEKLLLLEGMRRLIMLLDILQTLAASTEIKIISNNALPAQNIGDAKRLNEIFDYVLMHYHQPIKLADVARLCHLTETSFSRYFRQHTKKSFSDFVVQIRLQQACKLLAGTDKSVTDICFACGFNNISNFNRMFKRSYKLNPLNYRKLTLSR